MGMVVRSSVSTDLQWLAEFLNIDPAHTKYIYDATGKTTDISFFWLVNDIIDVPEIWAMVRRVEEVQAGTTDRRLSARTVREIYSPRIDRQNTGVDLETAAEILVMSLFIKDCIEVYRKNGCRIAVNKSGKRVAFSALGDFAKAMSLSWEKEIHDEFWDSFSNSPEELLKKMVDLSNRKHGTATHSVRGQS